MKTAYEQLLENIDIGLIFLDRELRVCGWNRWMELHSGILEKDILGQPILERYPGLGEPKHMRQIRSVINFGSYGSFSQKLHQYLIPLKNPHQSAEYIPFMQQSCKANPMRDAEGNITGLFITVHDVTEYVSYEMKLLEMTKLDPLTRLHNRRYLIKRLEEELERARRVGTTFSVILIDIDHFKQFNDRHGHLCGDETLIEVGAILRDSIRSIDIIGRYGGEEFLCVLPETGMETGFVLAERLRSSVEQAPFCYNGLPLQITISLGLAEYSQETATTERLIAAADAALYRAKHEGRNRTVCTGSRTEAT